MFQNNSSKLTVVLILITLSMLTWLLFSNKQFTNSLPLIQLNPKENLTEKERCDTYYKTKEPRVLCTVFTTRASHSTRMKAIHDTWSKRCDIRLYMTGPKASDQQDDADMPFVYLNITDTLARLTDKHIGTIMHVYNNYMNDFDWFLYANDDTYIVVDNLKLFVQDKCPSEPNLYGKVMIYAPPQKAVYTSGDNNRGFIQGGSGWLSSHEAIRRFGEAMKKDAKFCVCKNGAIEDQEISDCYRKVNVYPGESRDKENRERFLMNAFADLWSHPTGEHIGQSMNPVRTGKDCCSTTAIGFHRVTNEEQYKMEYLMYWLNKQFKVKS